MFLETGSSVSLLLYGTGKEEHLPFVHVKEAGISRRASGA